MNTIDIPVVSDKRSCGDCTACCEGWLSNEVNGYKYYPGRPCHYLGDCGCTIYEQRPKEQCRDFSCLWLVNKHLPEWMRPSRCGVILTQNIIENITYIRMSETKEKVDASVLSYVIQSCLSNKANLLYQVEGGWNTIGSEDFVRAIQGVTS